MNAEKIKAIVRDELFQDGPLKVKMDGRRSLVLEHRAGGRQFIVSVSEVDTRHDAKVGHPRSRKPFTHRGCGVNHFSRASAAACARRMQA